MEKDAYYFPHFCNARHDRKVKRLVKELGVEGYGLFFMTLEVLREQLDFKYPLSDLDLLADEFGTSEQKLRVVICNYKLFEVDEEESFFSPKLITYLQPYLEMKKKRSLAGKIGAEKRWGVDGNANGNANGNAIAQLKHSYSDDIAKNSKVKESKVKENIYSAFFENVWSVYPNKKGKAQVKDSQRKVLHDLGEEVILKCIKRYKQDKPDWQQYQNGSTFFNGGYIDYLDENYKVKAESKPKKPIQVVVEGYL